MVFSTYKEGRNLPHNIVELIQIFVWDVKFLHRLRTSLLDLGENVGNLLILQLQKSFLNVSALLQGNVRRSLSVLASLAMAEIWHLSNLFLVKEIPPRIQSSYTSPRNPSTSLRCTRIHLTPTKERGRHKRKEHKERRRKALFTIRTCITLCTWNDISSWGGLPPPPKGERSSVDIASWAFNTATTASSKKEPKIALSLHLDLEPLSMEAISLRKEVGEAGR